MRNITISIYQRTGVTRDNQYIFDSQGVLGGSGLSAIYQLISMSLNYSLVTSQATSNLLLGMSESQSDDNILRSGQPVVITDNGNIIFEGIILSAQYVLLPFSANSQGGLYADLILAPSIYQLTLTPLIFDQVQAEQVAKITGVNVESILYGNVTQSAPTNTLLTAIIANTDYSNFFSKKISALNLPDELYLMTSSGQSKDLALRQSIDYYNCVLYQQTDGEIVIRQLDSGQLSPFNIDLDNELTNDNVLSVLSYNYSDNAYSTPCAISNSCMLPQNFSNGSFTTNAVLTYIPSPEYFPRLKELQLSGWFTGQMGITQINDNIMSNPTTATSLNTFFSTPSKYMIASQASGVKDQFLAAYQALLTAKQMAMALSGYAGLEATVSLDDPKMPTNLPETLGTVMSVQNCDLKTGIVATVNRSYSAQGSYMTFTLVPLGSFTGFWLSTPI